MQTYYFTELPYPQAWSLPDMGLRVSLPSVHCDPEHARQLYTQCYDAWQLADELGYGIMVNEHHASATCLNTSAVVGLSIAARITRKARLLALGIPIANRVDPVRVAEEMAMVDVISGGRLDLGLVRGVPYEAALSPLSPVTGRDRFWEAHDLIKKALTTHSGPFNWNGVHFQARAVNVWPRVYQAPHPPMWVTTNSARTIGPIAKLGYVAAMFLGGYKIRDAFEAYRKTYLETFGRPAPMDRFAYSGLVAIGTSKSEWRRRADTLLQVLRVASRIADPFQVPSGYVSAVESAAMMREGGGGGHRPLTGLDGKKIHLDNAGVEELIAHGIMFAGTPDEVYQQIIKFSVGVGGLGHFLAMIHGADLNFAETEDSIRLFGKEVLPRLLAHQSIEAEVAA